MPDRYHSLLKFLAIVWLEALLISGVLFIFGWKVILAVLFVALVMTVTISAITFLENNHQKQNKKEIT